MKRRATRKRSSALRDSSPTLRAELQRLRTVIEAQGMIIDELRKESATHLRRCAELQADVDLLKKAVGTTV